MAASFTEEDRKLYEIFYDRELDDSEYDSNYKIYEVKKDLVRRVRNFIDRLLVIEARKLDKYRDFVPISNQIIKRYKRVIDSFWGIDCIEVSRKKDVWTLSVRLDKCGDKKSDRISSLDVLRLIKDLDIEDYISIENIDSLYETIENYKENEGMYDRFSRYYHAHFQFSFDIDKLKTYDTYGKMMLKYVRRY